MTTLRAARRFSGFAIAYTAADSALACANAGTALVSLAP